MKKVFAYVGSRNPNSRTLYNTKKIINSLDKKYPKRFKFEIVTPNELYVSPATGCKNCFNHGFCPIEEKNIDQSSELKEKLLDSDFIILASPVYSHNVSADMKAVIDRLSYWGHLFRLAGKSGIVLATADNNGVNFVSDYLEKVAMVMGLNVIDKLSITANSPLSQDYLEELIQDIYEYAYNIQKIEVDERAEMSFQTYKKIYQSLPLTLAEPKYWKENGMFEHNSLQDYVNEILKARQSVSNK
ncbi:MULTISPECIES: flavodoxin family protein [Anoxybacillaceae]|uniref:NADPH-dependent FMN reductase-like domain-containing protein n=1 Tax=Parageobacillus toebii TaxID=153151 RepID=A0A150MUC8_9BACL|nr:MULTISPECIES: flavodoxin family protein [Bacillaceae]KYD27965.1 hypothetical protein B4110_3743 [Parageobacillus toebii]OAO78596.1 hypothetical protein A0O32_2149 [Anoxybacillus flavithermus]